MILKSALLALLLAALAVLAVIDHQQNRLPDRITLPLLWAGLLANTGSIFASLPEAVLGAAVGYLSIRLIHDGRAMISGSPGIGLGDAKLFAALGAWYGWRALPAIVVAGAAVSLIFYYKRTDKPFGVGLATASIGISLAEICCGEWSDSISSVQFWPGSPSQFLNMTNLTLVFL